MEAARAEAKLAEMDLVEDLGRLFDEEGRHPLRRSLAEQYRQVIGVSPTRREELRSALKRVIAGGRMAVADVIDLVGRGNHANGSV